MRDFELLKVKKNLWSVFRDHLLKEIDPDDLYDMQIVEALDIYIADFEAQIETKPYSLSYLAELKRGIRLAMSVINHIQERYGAELQHWYFGKPAETAGEELYAVMQQIVSDLATAVWAIECDIEAWRPGSIKLFDEERASPSKYAVN